MTKKIPIGAGLEPALIHFPGMLSYRKGHGTFRPALFDGCHQIGNAIGGIPRILATLKHKGAKTEFVTLTAACHNLVVSESVAFGRAIATSQSAVEAVATTVARHLYKATYIYAKSELLTGSSDGTIT
jgi:hypothetical protein